MIRPVNGDGRGGDCGGGRRGGGVEVYKRRDVGWLERCGSCREVVELVVVRQRKSRGGVDKEVFQ